eukprot:TRINITY_DN8029_c0_g1_i1.p1 TRINITY_DN8029_c0_g1~~TRINITY_DN8029_c0_g1_i1.p1  ORF type:complete len:331 (+),score=59.58 TRINITY_DN8029_c0_g1_i1:50-1042(+)
MPTEAHGYTYQPATGSLLFRHVLEPAYRRMVDYLPRWLTPNMMTVVGITLTGTASGMMLLASHEGRDLGKGALYLAGGLNLVYMTLDNLDGKQARRLKLSSAIGEYLDHGGDCWTSLLSIWCMFDLAKVPYKDHTLCLLSVTTSLVHLYHLVTGKSTLGGDYFSADEGMLTFCIVPFLSAAFPSLWSTAVTDTLSLTQLCTYIFCFGQGLCVVEMYRSLGKDLFNQGFLQVLATTGLMFLGRDHTVPWVITTAMLCSFSIHHLIVAGSVKKTHASVRPTLPSVAVGTGLPIAWLCLPEHRLAITGCSVAVHLAQMVYNCRMIIAEKAKRA